MQILPAWEPHLVLASFFMTLYLDPTLVLVFAMCKSTDLELVRVGSKLVDSLVWIRLSRANIG